MLSRDGDKQPGLTPSRIRVAPSVAGSLIAAGLGAVYVAVTSPLELWTFVWRMEIVGGAVLTLLTYFASWAFFEIDPSFEQLLSRSKLEWWIRLAAQCCLSGSLVALGINLEAFLVLYTLFFVLVALWDFLVRDMVRGHNASTVMIHDAINVVLCVGFVVLVRILYQDSLAFQSSVAVFASDRLSYDIRRTYVQGQLSDIVATLCFIIGVMLANLGVLLTRLFKNLQGAPLHTFAPNQLRVR